jgi:hypothetical protein
MGKDKGDNYSGIELPALFAALGDSKRKLANLLSEENVDADTLLKGLARFLTLENRRKAIHVRRLRKQIYEQHQVIEVISHGIAEYLASEQKSDKLKEKYTRIYFCLLRNGVPFSDLKDHIGNYGRLRKLRLNYLNKERRKREKPKLKL